MDGDIVRENLLKGLIFSKEDWDINIWWIGFVVYFLSRNGVVVIIAVISFYKVIWNEIREMYDNFIEVYINVFLEVCE